MIILDWQYFWQFWGFALLGTGLWAMIGTALNLDIYMNAPQTRSVVSSLGRTGTRILHFIIGIFLSVIGLFLFGWLGFVMQMAGLEEPKRRLAGRPMPVAHQPAAPEVEAPDNVPPPPAEPQPQPSPKPIQQAPPQPIAPRSEESPPLSAEDTDTTIPAEPVPIAVTPPEHDFRVWTDATGNFRVDARLVAHDDAGVTLEKRDGRTIVVPLAKLSRADQALVQAMAQQSSREDVDPLSDRAQDEEPEQKTTPAALAAAGRSGFVETDWSLARQVSLTPVSGNWQFTVGVSSAPVPDNGGRPIRLPPTRDFFEKPTSMAVNGTSGRAVIGYVLDNPTGSGPQTRLILCDLAKGLIVEPESVPGEWAPLALNDNGRQVLMRRNEFHLGEKDLLQCWNIDTSGISKGLSWTPYDDLRSSHRDVKWAAFLKNQRVATLNEPGKLIVWDAETAQPIYHFTAASMSTPALSPDRKYLAFVAQGQLNVLDGSEGRVLAQHAWPNRTSPPVLCFSSSGSQLISIDHRKLCVWDFATGELNGELAMKYGVMSGKTLAIGEEYLLVGDRDLVDLKSGDRIWTFHGHHSVESLGDVCWFLFCDRNNHPGALVPVAIPHPKLTAALEQGRSRDTSTNPNGNAGKGLGTSLITSEGLR